jgi:hypothetical protein
LGFLDFFSGGSSAKTSARAPSKAEKTISKNIAAQSTQAMPLFEQLLAQSRGQQGFNDQLFSQFQRELAGESAALPPELQGLMAAQQQLEAFGLGGDDAALIQQALGLAGRGTGATPEQLAQIQQATDLAIQGGLSDLGRFRDDTLQTIAQNSAARGLRPTDTPIWNQSGQFGLEMNRQAEQMVRGLRQQQAQQILQFPLQAGAFEMQQLGGASDMANRRAAFLQNLDASNQEARMNFGRGLTATGLGIAQGFSGADSLGPLISQRNFQSGKVSQANQPSGAQLLSSLLPKTGAM